MTSGLGGAGMVLAGEKPAPTIHADKVCQGGRIMPPVLV